jgi:hypothetical protein
LSLTAWLSGVIRQVLVHPSSWTARISTGVNPGSTTFAAGNRLAGLGQLAKSAYRRNFSGQTAKEMFMGERRSPNWRLVERIVLIIEMVIDIFDRFKLR